PARKHHAAGSDVETQSRALPGGSLTPVCFSFLFHVSSKVVFGHVELEGVGVQADDSASRRHQSHSFAFWNRNWGTAIECRQESVTFLFQMQAAEAADMNCVFGPKLALDDVERCFDTAGRARASQPAAPCRFSN